MRLLIRRIHTYLGLLNFSTLLVFGIAGLTATFHAGPERSRTPLAMRYMDFAPPPNASDAQVAASIYETVRIPLSAPIPNFAIKRNRDHQLALDFYTLNGIHHVTLLESERRLRIEAERTNLWFFLDNAHATTQGGNPPDWRVRWWGYYNEVAIWCLLAMGVSGVYLWLASRPGFRWAQISLAAGGAAFLVLFFLSR